MTTKLSVQQGQTSRTVVFNAGGIKLNSAVSKTIPLNSAKVRFDIYGTEFNARGERKLIARNVRPAPSFRSMPGPTTSPAAMAV